MCFPQPPGRSLAACRGTEAPIGAAPCLKKALSGTAGLRPSKIPVTEVLWEPEILSVQMLGASAQSWVAGLLGLSPTTSSNCFLQPGGWL